MMTAAAGIYLFWNAVSDIRTREIPLALSGLFALAGLIMCAYQGRPLPSVAASVMPGLLLLVGSLLSDGALGAGDGIAVAVLGLFENADMLAADCAAGFLAAGFGAFLMLASGRKGGASLPFLPFLAAGFAAVHIVCALQC
ncbi:MAG: prepilin peptidase [Lachnospiraceae bacterium]|nr:prepilin peptidase [Lachnospiraceae bacterium]